METGGFLYLQEYLFGQIMLVIYNYADIEKGNVISEVPNLTVMLVYGPYCDTKLTLSL